MRGGNKVKFLKIPLAFFFFLSLSPSIFILLHKKGVKGIENGIPFHKINELEIRLMIMGFAVLTTLIHIYIYKELFSSHKFFAVCWIRSSRNQKELTSAAGFPPDDTHSNSISRSSVVTISSILALPFTIFGCSGGTNTVICALLERIAVAPM